MRACPTGPLLMSVALLCAACGPKPEHEPPPSSTPLATPAAGLTSGAPTRASSTRVFVAKLTMSRRLELETSRLAQRRGRHALVREFARTTRREAEKSLREFARLATAADSPPPAGLDAPARAALDAVRRSTPLSFDAHYLDAIINTRAAAIDEVERYAASGADHDLRAFAASALPGMRARLQEADTLRQSVNLENKG